MNYFNKLKGFERSPPGLEWKIWKKLPVILAAGTVLPLLASACVYLFNELSSAAGGTSSVELFFYMMLGLVLLYWSLVLTLAIGCAIVIVMKGPAYVADAYLMEEPPHANEADVQG